jgi:hypothetical protein
MEDVMAEALSSKIDIFDRVRSNAEAARNNALREIIVSLWQKNLAFESSLRCQSWKFPALK